MLEKRGNFKRAIFLVSLIAFVTLFFIVSMFVYGVTNCWTYSSESTCEANTKCTWHDDAWGSGWCEQIDCWSFYTQKDCSNANATYNLSCKWQTPSLPPGWCTEANCWDFGGTNQTVCENDTRRDYGLSCLWGPTDPSPNYIGYNCFGGPQCYRTIPYTEAECKNITGCSWGACYQKGFWDYTAQASCESNPSYYWRSDNICQPIGCYDEKHKAQTSCDNSSDSLVCKWNSKYSYCETLNCWSFNYNQTGCQSTAIPGLECIWKDPWCETKACWQNNDETSCKGKTGYDAKNCTWHAASVVTTGWCEKIGCWNVPGINSSNGSIVINETQCVNNSYGLNCVWESNTWGSFCYENRNVSVLSCSNITDEKKCFDSMWCWWDSTSNRCNEPTAGTEGGAIGGSLLAPGCWIFDLNQSSCTNTTGCAYDSTLKLCNLSTTVAADIADGISSNGLNCTLLNNTNLCNGATFLPYCCEWQGSKCQQNKYSTTCHDNLKKPPEGANYCDDYNAYTSEAKCNEIANNPWYMPCRWNNNTKHCEFKGDKFFTQGEEGDIDLVDNKEMCENGVGGLWITESYCGAGNMTNASIAIGRCAPKLGSKGGNCDSACFRCEFKPDGSNHSTEGAARTACEGSALGFCVWKSDSGAQNKLGFCEPSAEIKGGSVGKCDSNNCDACNSYNSVNAKTKCQEAKCEWKIDLLDATKGFCVSAGKTTCLDRCESCNEQKSCVEKGRGINGSCTWDSNLGLCKKTSTGDNTGAVETCFDGIDNDGDAKVDCADGSCFTDPFCGGSSIKDCWQYSNNASCVDNGCRWFNDTYGSWCDQPGAVCWQYDGDSAGCLQQSACQWQPAAAGTTMCNLNESVWDECAPLSQSDCNNNNRCYWFVDPYLSTINASKGWCGHRHEICHFNQTLMTNSNASCSLAWQKIGGNLNCTWYFDPWSQNSGYCESSCFSLGNDCSLNGMCKSKDGWCNPSGFGGNGSNLFNCFQFESQTTCINQTNCKWFSDPKASCDVSHSTDCFNFKAQTGCNSNLNCSWTGLDANSGWCDQKVNRCHWNFTLSTSEDNCNADPLCYWKSWGGSYSSCEPKVANSTTESGCASLNGTWRSGWCESASVVTSFTGMDMETPPTPLGNELCPENGISPFSDICYFGMKDSKDNFGLGTGVSNIRDAAMCNGVSTWQGVGNGNYTVKFYWYVDSDGKSSGGCALNSNTSSSGWDIYFRYEASYVNGSVKESKKVHRCISSEWKASDIKISAWKEKMCNDIQGGMISVNKDDLTAISGLLNLSSTLRFYAATANETTNETTPLDTVGPAYFTPGTIDFIPECCWAAGDQNIDCDGDGLNPANDPECTLLMYKGYIPFEDCFGNSIDEDADTLTDCNDPDCKGNPYCVENKLGVEAPGYVDNTAPKIVYLNVEKYPDAVLLSFDTDEPANGSLDFYYNVSNCITLNKTVYDVGIYNTNTQKYKNWHEVELYNDTGINSLNYTLSGNKTYFYKLKVCDNAGNCAQSACSNFTTAISAAKCKKCSFIFNMDMPTGWILDMDLDADGTYETALRRQCGASAGVLLNYTTARSVNLRFRDNSTNTTLFFLDTKLTRSLAHNEEIRDVDDAGGIKSGTTSTTAGTTVGYSGLNKEMSNKLVDKFHPKSCMIQIDKGTGACSLLYHCDDDLKNCIRRDTEAGVSLNETGPNYCIWKIPCIFSTYAGGVPGSAPGSSSSSSSSSGGGGGGGGGGAASSANTEASAARVWEAIEPGSVGYLTINNEKIAIIEVAMDVSKKLANPSITVESLKSNPLSTAAGAKVYQYIQLTRANILDSDTSKITVKFKVPKSWLAANSVSEDDIALFRYSENKWNDIPTAKISIGASDVFYQSALPGFSTFAIGAKEQAQAPPVEELELPETIPIVEAAAAEPAEEAAEQPVQEIEKPADKTLISFVVIGIVIFAALFIGFYAWKKIISRSS
ncbi:PGF-pre-PGF domain-containing protein [Candidatus Woesearchaeota archaeon]|nr:PGF-pre-PGF domain-containing protein [Candidatus Woesearchaeota archaeon]